MIKYIDNTNALEHHGVKGQKWGIRRYQNEDGTLKNKKVNEDGTTKKMNPKLKTGLIAGGAALAAAAAVGTAWYIKNKGFKTKLASSLADRDIKVGENAIKKHYANISAKAAATRASKKTVKTDPFDPKVYKTIAKNRLGAAKDVMKK